MAQTHATKTELGEKLSKEVLSRSDEKVNKVCLAIFVHLILIGAVVSASLSKYTGCVVLIAAVFPFAYSIYYGKETQKLNQLSIEQVKSDEKFFFAEMEDFFASADEKRDTDLVALWNNGECTDLTIEEESAAEEFISQQMKGVINNYEQNAFYEDETGAKVRFGSLQTYAASIHALLDKEFPKTERTVTLKQACKDLKETYIPNCAKSDYYTNDTLHPGDERFKDGRKFRQTLTGAPPFNKERLALRKWEHTYEDV